MLVLSRKEKESIIIGENIEITIMGIKGDCVKIGINAPSNVKIYRKEIYEEIQKANREAAYTDNVNIDSIKDIEKFIKG